VKSDLRPSLPTRLIVRVVRVLPASLVFFTARMMGWIGFCFNGVSRKRAIDNVRTCLPYESHLYHKKIALKGFQHMVLLAVDLLRLPETNSEAIHRINVRNKHYVIDALKEGNGVVIISAHFGNICMLPPAFDGLSEHPAYISRRSARRVSWIIREARAYHDRYLKPRTTFDALESSSANAVKLAHFLKRGNVVIVFADLTFGSGTVLVDLFGSPYEMSRLPASLAILNGAPLIPAMTHRNADGTYEIVVESPIEKPKSPNHTAKYEMTKEFAAILERYVRSSPEQWCWTHQQRWQKPLSSA
jgi:Kdo2-lipid IVA lauroyltransferase/acyltransferase